MRTALSVNTSITDDTHPAPHRNVPMPFLREEVSVQRDTRRTARCLFREHERALLERELSLQIRKAMKLKRKVDRDMIEQTMKNYRLCLLGDSSAEYGEIEEWRGEKLKDPLTVRIKDHPANPDNVCPPFLSLVPYQDIDEELYKLVGSVGKPMKIYGALQRRIPISSEQLNKDIEDLIKVADDSVLYYMTVLK